MASPVPHEVIDDDSGDGFDWEAAVREIDFACQGAETSTSCSNDAATGIPHESLMEPRRDNGNVNVANGKPRKHGNARQSTLDKFVRAVDRVSVSENESRGHGVHDQNGGDVTGCSVKIDPEAAKTWIYPVNVSYREYQFSITKKALFSNTLVALPTGLGKTLIAAVVMYNYFRWFPEGKIVFAAPSRPLVLQQIEACHNIVGIPQEWTIDMTGQTSPSKRACLWKVKRVFFVTPQVFEKDIQSGTCLVKHLVCLVIDEAHRALGNYSYCVAIRELMAVPVHLRILALTATPGSKQRTIQNVIDNLNISSLEYRNESDHDVSPYVHDRKLELIQVPMGEDAAKINDLLLEMIKPFVSRLCAIGVLHNRDFQTLSPCELLNSRDKFRQAPPVDLSHMKYGEIEGYFGVLITLYHIRKLLSSHGIKPAYEMLEEKLQHGSFAKFLSRNEIMWKAKLLMQQSLSHGAPNPKLSKMIQILSDHFKSKDPKHSRVIIFSNFRGSVRDIMDALMNVGEFVKATEFIGQSSGKAMKGQTQKVQQAVLEKFRAGGYNVIVATSIGEEGLDIMEVDLVICFDANISPLRMIQRMGRTGRKHDGQVVVLACEGSELKGYLRKQANSNAVKKHMRNGGINSFDFHPSPRMIPHVIKPAAQLVELSIECFVPRGKKVKDSSADSPKFMDKLSDAETELIMKYFHPSREDTWRPSLTAFPHFQAFPSRVHKIMHSFRTGMLIDTMQHLQGLSYSIDTKTFLVEGMVSSPHNFEAETVAQDGNDEEDSQMCHEPTRAFSPKKIPDIEEIPTEISSKEKDSMLGLPCQNVSVHHFVHETNFVSIDACGQVLIKYVPLLPSMEEGPCKDSSNELCTELVSHMKQESSLRTSPGDCEGQNMCVEGIEDRKTQTRYMNDTFASNTSLYNSEPDQGQNMNEIERTIIETPAAKRDLSNSEDTAGESPDCMVKKTPILELDDCNNDIGDTELSPRLTNMIKKGVVPESPIGDTPKYDMVCMYLRPNNETCVSHLNCHAGVIDGKICEKPVNPLVLSKSNERNEHIVPALVSLAKLDTCLSLMRSSSENHKVVYGNDSSSVRVGVSTSSVDEEIHSPFVKMNNNVGEMGSVSDSRDIQEIHTPLGNLMSSSCSKDWRLNSGETSKTVKQAHKLRRLRKLGDPSWRKLSESVKEDVGFSGKNLGISFSGERPSSTKQNRGKQKPDIDVRAFIEEEVEVSSGAEVSDDEEDKDDSSFDDSFIDDRINPTATSTQAEDKSDMMAIYRRSLLSQSPMVCQPNVSSSFSPDPQSTRCRTTETENSSARLSNSFETPCTDIQSANRSSLRSSVSCQIDAVRISGVAIPDESNGAQREIESKMENRKRKLNFVQVGSIAVTRYEQEQSFHSKTANRISSKAEAQRIGLNEDIFYDDQFYEGLDLDAVEAQATKLLRHKSESSLENNGVAANTAVEQNNIPTSPTFDLGI